MRWIAIVAAVLVLPVLLSAEEKKKDDKAPSYTKDVKPIIDANCVRCHKGAKAKGGFDATSVESILKGAKKTKKVLVPGKADESHFAKVLEGGKPAMPPKNQKQRPTADEIALIKKWIESGAKDDSK
jgi:mono/diheme cytochrome c family protein